MAKEAGKIATIADLMTAWALPNLTDGTALRNTVTKLFEQTAAALPGLMKGGVAKIGGGQAETRYGTTAADLYDGRAGNDRLYGRDGGDVLIAGHGQDQAHGEAGNDLILDMANGTDASLDQYYGGTGHDVIIGGTRDNADGGDGNDWLIARAGSVTFQGGAGNDLLMGGYALDRLLGGNDSDRLFGYGGNDYMRGDAGDDWLDGGDGSDTLYGGLGTDMFVASRGADVIHDFGRSDRLDLSAWSIANMKELMGHAKQLGNKSVITLDATRGDTLTLMNTTLANLKAEQMIFSAAEPSDPLFYFSGTNNTSGRELWAYDGAGVNRLTDIAPGAQDSFPGYITPFDGDVFFTVRTADQNATPWKLDGATGKAAALVDATTGAAPQEVRGFTISGGDLWFASSINGGPAETVWRYDADTETLKKLNFNAPTGPTGLQSPYFAGVIGEKVILTGTNSDGSSNFWQHDAATGQTKLLNRFGAAEGLNVEQSFVVDGELVFVATDPDGGAGGFGTSALYRLNPLTGTVSKTAAVSDSTSGFGEFATVGDDLYFQLTGPNGYQDALWRYDADAGKAERMIGIGNGQPVRDVGEFLVTGNGILFEGESASGRELWLHQNGQTTQVADIAPNGSFAQIDNFTQLGNRVFFTADDGAHGNELWAWDGSKAARLTDINPGAADSYPAYLTAVDNRLYFTAEVNAGGGQERELWAYDPTTGALSNLNPGNEVFQPGPIVPADTSPFA